MRNEFATLRPHRGALVDNWSKAAAAWYRPAMSLRVLARGSALGGALLALGVLAPAGCAVDAVGVEACRSIEKTRCAAAAKCAESAPLSVPDVEACQRFYDVQCLHGVALEKAPSDAQVKACTRALDAAGTCAAASGTGDAPLASCAIDVDSTEISTACGALQRPELLSACAFLVAAPDEEPRDAAADTAKEAASDADAPDGG
jgi:hypothetical protein